MVSRTRVPLALRNEQRRRQRHHTMHQQRNDGQQSERQPQQSPPRQRRLQRQRLQQQQQRRNLAPPLTVAHQQMGTPGRLFPSGTWEQAQVEERQDERERERLELMEEGLHGPDFGTSESWERQDILTYANEADYDRVVKIFSVLLLDIPQSFIVMPRISRCDRQTGTVVLKSWSHCPTRLAVRAEAENLSLDTLTRLKREMKACLAQLWDGGVAYRVSSETIYLDRFALRGVDGFWTFFLGGAEQTADYWPREQRRQHNVLWRNMEAAQLNNIDNLFAPLEQQVAIGASLGSVSLED